MRKLVELAVRRKVATAAIAFALTVLGVLSFIRLPVDFLPDIAYPLIKVHIWWRGATPEEIEEHVAEVIEREMASVEGLDYLESSSIEGSYTLEVNFRYGVDVNDAFRTPRRPWPVPPGACRRTWIRPS
jgi:hydrophobic/amphiphilic exporter-1 (mainly G- bacteria), HAE1 family